MAVAHDTNRPPAERDGEVRAGTGDPVRVADQWFRIHPRFQGRLRLIWEPVLGSVWVAIFERQAGRVRWIACCAGDERGPR